MSLWWRKSFLALQALWWHRRQLPKDNVVPPLSLSWGHWRICSRKHHWCSRLLGSCHALLTGSCASVEHKSISLSFLSATCKASLKMLWDPQLAGMISPIICRSGLTAPKWPACSPYQMAMSIRRCVTNRWVFQGPSGGGLGVTGIIIKWKNKTTISRHTYIICTVAIDAFAPWRKSSNFRLQKMIKF